MSPHGKTVLRDLGVVLHVPGLMALASLPVCWVFGERYGVVPFLVTAAVALALGRILFRAGRGAKHMRLRHAMVTAVISWMLVPLVGMLPFLLVAWLIPEADASASVLVFRDVWAALFESVSGFTSTGLSMADRPSQLPHCLQWWRSFTQWVGGVGVILLMLSVFHPSGDAHRLYFSEAHGKTLVPDMAESVRTIWWIYLGYTAAAIALLALTGMDGWQAINYGMAGIATGGFGVTDNSLGDFSTAPRLAMILIMLTGAISFVAHYRILTEGRVGVLWKDKEHRALMVLWILGAPPLALENAWADVDAGLLDNLFQWTSALSTTGFQTVVLDDWSPTALLILCFAMICGGAIGSTTGGLKLRRIILLAEGTYARVRGIALHPWRLMEHKPMVDADRDKSVRLLEAAAIMLALWMAVILAGAVLLLHASGADFALQQVIFEAVSALGNAGLTAGVTSADLHWTGKLGLIVIMWMGRLEIIPVLVLVAALIVGLRHRWRS